MKADFYNVKMCIPNDFEHKENNGGIPTKDKTYFLYEDSYFDEKRKEVKFCFISIGDTKEEQNLVKKLNESFNLTIVGRKFHYTEFKVESK